MRELFSDDGSLACLEHYMSSPGSSSKPGRPRLLDINLEVLLRFEGLLY